MAGVYNFQVNQRVRIKTASESNHKPPTESVKGALGTIAPQMTDDWAGTLLELEPGTIVTYYVVIDGGTTELIAADWLEPASAGE
jgi:hypothetical protein